MSEESFVFLGRGSELAHTITTATTAAGFTPIVAVECFNLGTLRSLVSAGIGVPAHTAAVAWRSDSRPSAAGEAMLGLVRKHLTSGRGS